MFIRSGAEKADGIHSSTGICYDAVVHFYKMHILTLWVGFFNYRVMGASMIRSNGIWQNDSGKKVRPMFFMKKKTLMGLSRTCG
jgi:hypothetical protein